MTSRQFIRKYKPSTIPRIKNVGKLNKILQGFDINQLLYITTSFNSYLKELSKQYAKNKMLLLQDRLECQCLKCNRGNYHDEKDDEEIDICFETAKIYINSKMQRLDNTCQIQYQRIQTIKTYLSLCQELYFLKSKKIQFEAKTFLINKSLLRSYNADPIDYLPKNIDIVEQFAFHATMRDYLILRFPSLPFSTLPFKSLYLYKLGSFIPSSLNSCYLYSTITNEKGESKTVKRYSMKALQSLDYIIEILESIPFEIHIFLFDFLKMNNK